MQETRLYGGHKEKMDYGEGYFSQDMTQILYCYKALFTKDEFLHFIAARFHKCLLHSRFHTSPL